MCKNEISEKELLESLKNIDSNKTLVNDGLTKEFCKTIFKRH